MAYKKNLLACMVLSAQFLGAMSGSRILTTDGFLAPDLLQRRIASIIENPQLSPAQRLLGIRLFLRQAQEEAVTRTFYNAVNNINANVLDEAMNTHENVDLFRMLLAFRADPNVETRNGSLLQQARENSNRGYLKAIEEQSVMSLVEPAIASLLLGNETEKSAETLKDLLSARVLTREELVKVIQLLIAQKQQEVGKLDELLNMFEPSVNIPIKKEEQVHSNGSVAPYLLGAVVGGAIVLGVKYGLEQIQ